MPDEAHAPDANNILSIQGAAALRAEFDGAGMTEHTNVRPSLYRWTDPATLPKRDWLLGRMLCRGIVSMTVAPGGTGKSALSVCEAVALASGSDLLDQEIGKPVRVWYWNLEDSMEELQKRVQAVCLHYGIERSVIAGRLFVDSGMTRPVCLAHGAGHGYALNDEALQRLQTAIKEERIDALILDPFVSSHQLDENNNMQMDLLMKALSRIASRTYCAISIVHHTRKAGPEGRTSTESARGAKSMSDAARIVRVLNPMSKGEAEDHELSSPDGFFSVSLDKQNLSAANRQRTWYQMVSVALGNGEDSGVVSSWVPPARAFHLDPIAIRQIQSACAAHPLGENSQASDWIGLKIAPVVDPDADDPRQSAKVKRTQRWLTGEGYLRAMREPKKGKAGTRPVVTIGRVPDDD